MKTSRFDGDFFAKIVNDIKLSTIFTKTSITEAPSEIFQSLPTCVKKFRPSSSRRCIQNPVKYLKWRVLRKELTAVIR